LGDRTEVRAARHILDHELDGRSNHDAVMIATIRVLDPDGREVHAAKGRRRGTIKLSARAVVGLACEFSIMSRELTAGKPSSSKAILLILLALGLRQVCRSG
jgi:hypothetical protein